MKPSLQGLKKYMLSHKVSVIDLDWGILRKHKISMQKLLKWEMKQKLLTPKTLH